MNELKATMNDPKVLPEWKHALMNHIETHQQLLAQITGQMQQNSMQGAPASNGSPVAGSDQRTEGMFGNAVTGAAQQGAPPPQPVR